MATVATEKLETDRCLGRASRSSPPCRIRRVTLRFRPALQRNPGYELDGEEGVGSPYLPLGAYVLTGPTRVVEVAAGVHVLRDFKAWPRIFPSGLPFKSNHCP